MNIVMAIGCCIGTTAILMYFLSYVEMVERINEMAGVLQEIKKDLKNGQQTK